MFLRLLSGLKLSLVPGLMSSVLCLLMQAPVANADSSFNEIYQILINQNPFVETQEAADEVSVYRSGQLPTYEVTTSKFVQNGVDLIKRAAFRTINEFIDYSPRHEKLIHSNGICLVGEWQITEKSNYSGYFSQGTRAPIVARVSTATSNTLAGDKRGFGVAGKIFPTNDLNQVVRTANFFTVDVLAGTEAVHFVDTVVTNEPDIGFQFSLLYMLAKLSKSLGAADSNPLFRQLYEVSEAGVTEGQTVKTPHWMSLKASQGSRVVDEEDFRNELNIAKYHPNGFDLDIKVSETTKDPSEKGWKRLGKIHFTESIVSYGCDRQLHFHHPKIK